MNKSELVEQVSRKANVTRVLADRVLTATIESVIEAVANSDRVALVGFGSFEQRTRNARIGRNPQTGEEIQIPPQTVPVFSAGKIFRDRVKHIENNNVAA